MDWFIMLSFVSSFLSRYTGGRAMSKVWSSWANLLHHADQIRRWGQYLHHTTGATFNPTFLLFFTTGGPAIVLHSSHAESSAFSVLSGFGCLCWYHGLMTHSDALPPSPKNAPVYAMPMPMPMPIDVSGNVCDGLHMFRSCSSSVKLPFPIFGKLECYMLAPRRVGVLQCIMQYTLHLGTFIASLLH